MIVERRWAMTNVVRFFITSAIASWINVSDSESREEVASSKMRIAAS